MTAIIDELNSFFAVWVPAQLPTSPALTTFLMVLSGITAVAGAVLGSVMLNKLLFFFSKGKDIAPVYGSALRLHFWVGAVVFGACVIFFLHAGSLAGCGGTTSATAASRNSVSARLVNSDGFPWRDMCAVGAAPATTATAAATPVPTPSAISPPLSGTGAIASKETASLMFGLLMCAPPLLFFLITWAQRKPEYTENDLRQWGHYKDPQPDASKFGAAPWLKSVGWPLAWILLAGWLFAIQYLPLFQAPGSVMVPIAVWVWIGGALFLFLGLLLAGGEAPQPEAEVAPSPQGAKFTRRAWEAFMGTHGFALLRGQAGTSNPKPAPVTEGRDQPNLQARAGIMDPGAPSDSGSEADNELRYIQPPRSTADTMSTMYTHQGVFVRKVVSAARQSDPVALLMHVDQCSGRTTAVFEAALRLSVQHKSSLLLYPSESEARRAALEYKRNANALQQFVRLAEDTAIDEIRANDVLVASVDWLVETLLPSFRQRSVDGAPLQGFLRQMGLVVLEDIEMLSGVRATNLVLVMRRLYRILNAYRNKPAMGLTVCCNPSRASGVIEYAQRLCGPLDLHTVADRCDAPNFAVHAYMLGAAPTTPNDAQGVDPLSAMAQCALVSRAFGAPSRLEGTHESVRRHDLVPPRWVKDLAKQQGVTDDFSLEAPLHHPPLRSWVRMDEVFVGETLSLDERIRIGGLLLNAPSSGSRNRSGRSELNYEEVHLVVMHPQFHDRGIVRFMLDRFLSHRETRPAQETRWRQLRRMGSRLVNGEPSQALLRKHIEAAMLELPATEEELLQLLPDAKALHECIENLKKEDAIQTQGRRTISLDDPPKMVMRDILVPRIEHPARTPLDTVTIDDVDLRLVGNSSVLRSVDVEQATRATYPGMLFNRGSQRYRVMEDRYTEFNRVRLPQYKVDKDASDLWIACDLDDSVAFTSPVFERSINAIQRGKLPPISYIERSTNESGDSIIRWRSHARVQERFHGRLECNRSPDERVRWTFHEWLKDPIQSTMEMETLVVSMPNRTLTPEGAATLRRMMEAAIRALIRVEDHALCVHVLEKLGELQPDLGTASTDVIVGEHPAILLLAPYNGQAGLIDSLGASPWGFVNNMLQFVCLWCRHLNEQESVAWEDIGYVGTLVGDDALAPAPQEALECVEALLGTWVPKHITDLHTQIDAPIEGCCLPLLRTTAPKGGESGAYSEPYTADLKEQVTTILGECPAQPTVEHLFRVFDWMHQYIQYQHDDEQYGHPEYIATPAETLQSLKGDCEDHALLLGSLLMSMGLHVRTVLVPGHALCQLYLGKTGEIDLAELAALLKQLRADQAAAWGIDASKRPYIKGELAEGWSQSGESYEHANEYIVYDNAWSELAVEEHDGELWLVLDTAMSGCYPGDPGGLATDNPQSGTTVQWAEGAWVQGATYQYPPKLA